MKDLNEQFKNVQVPTDQQLVTPWLCTTHWHEYMAGSGLSIDQLQFIRLPWQNEVDCKGLHGIIEHYINLPDPIKQ